MSIFSSASQNKPDPSKSGKNGGPSAPQKQDRNEYIPHFIAKKPFYLDDLQSDSDYLEHQRLQSQQSSDLDKWYSRGAKGARATKYRKGACENCGSMKHGKKDCLQRPRKFNAKISGKDIAADEVVESVELSWDGKRDRWNGYDPREHRRVVEEHKQVEMLRKLKEPGEVDEDGEKYADDAEIPGQGYDAANRISTRNLRIREDTAKYLVNLDLDSARYDPKTRTMVDKGGMLDKAAAMVEEENFIRTSGDAAEFERLQRVAWETQERGDKSKLHLQANPTEAEKLRREQEQDSKMRAQHRKKLLMEKYGGEAFFDKKNDEVEEEEHFVEYTEDGSVKQKIEERRTSKYPEDRYTGNHTSVWGSWWKKGKWGFACCHSFVKNSYCTGEEGIKAFEDAEAMRLGLVAAPDLKCELEEAPEEKVEKVEKIEEKKIEKKEGNDAETKKRKLRAMHGDVTEEELEDYRRKRVHAEDPMANFVDSV